MEGLSGRSLSGTLEAPNRIRLRRTTDRNEHKPRLDICLIVALTNIPLHSSLSRLLEATALLSFAILNLVFMTNSVARPVYADCAQDNDWTDKPCLDTPPYQRADLKEAWEPYYEYKGAAWMEMKKAEMDQAIDDGRLEDWVEYRSEPNNFANYNVYFYYYLNDQAPEINNAGRIIADDSASLSYSATWLIATIGIAVSGTAAILFVFKKLRLT